MAKVRVFKMRGNDGEMRDIFVCGKWYGLVGGKAIYHATDYPIKYRNISSLKDETAINYDSTTISTAEQFKKLVTEKEAEIIEKWGSLERYFGIESGRAM